MPLQRVRQYIEQYDDLKIVLFDDSTHTAELAAQTLGVTVGQIAKTLVFMADDNAIVMVTCGDKKVKTRHLAKAVGCKKIKFADGLTVEAVTGFTPGGVSPVGLLQKLPVYLDQSLYAYDIVYAAAGTANSALPIRPVRLKQITGAQIIDVCK